MQQCKLAIVVSHPIQHFCPQYSSWSCLDRIEIKVFFASRHGVDPYRDKGFGKEVQWKGLRLNFEHVFLPGAKGKDINAKIDSPDLQAALTEYNPDAVLVYGYSQRLQRQAIAWAKANNKRLLMISDSEPRQARSKVKNLFKKLYLPGLFSKIDLFLTVGDANESYYRGYGVPDYKFVRTFFPIDTEMLGQAIQVRKLQRERIRLQLGVPDDHIAVLMVGKLISVKRQVDLINASNLLHGINKKITIILAGTGEDEIRLKALTHRQGVGGVIFAGFLPPEELVHYYSASDVYVHSSSKEPHSLAISEAIYSGLPVIVSDKCGSYGPSDDVQIGLNGFVYPCGDVSTLVKLLCSFAGSPELMRQFSLESSLLGKQHQDLAHGKAIIQAIRILNMRGKG